MGNLRTALLAWLFARSTGRRFLLRIEDLDRTRAGSEAGQLRDLAAVGLDWDGIPVRQSERAGLYRGAVEQLRQAGLVYECFCTRREILEAPSAPHSPPGAYPGTCRNLSEAERAQRRRERPAALRLRAQANEFTVKDLLHGSYTGQVDDLVLVRNDGAASYNLAVVVDDAEQGIDQVVRGDDLLPSSPRQAYLAMLLGLPPVTYAHVPLALNRSGQRLAKRDGAVTLPELAAQGVSAQRVRAEILASLGLPGTLPEALAVFQPGALPLDPWVVEPEA